MRRASVADAELINDWVWRDSGVKPDFTGFLNDRNNVCFIEGEGGALFVWRGPGIFETHCFFEQRGGEVRDLSKAILETMHRDYGAELVWAAVPEESRKVKIYVRWLGFKPVEHRPFPHGECEVFQLEL